MENMLKVYIYQDGDRPIFHEPLLDGIYASEGWFMKLMEANKLSLETLGRLTCFTYLSVQDCCNKLSMYVIHTDIPT